MKKKRLIQVFEHERIYLKDKRVAEKFLYPEELEKLYEYNDRTGNIYFTAIRHGVRFNQYVGVIQVGQLTIEILPKADRNNVSHSQDDYHRWHGVLIDMLRVCKKIDVKSDSETELKRKNNSILDLYYQLFIDEVFMLLSRGLIKQYRRCEGNVNALKGRLHFAKNIQQNLIRKDKFYTAHQTYDQDYIFNQILLKAIDILGQTSYSSQILDSVRKIRVMMSDISLKEIYTTDFEKIRWGRKTESYRKAINIAQLIILNYAPDIKAGKENMLAILFDMNKLWEEYVFRILQLANKDGKYRLSFQNSKHFWETKTIRPDILIENIASQETFIIDTKWKVISSNNPSDDDLKQMYAYNMYWKAVRGILLYPCDGTQTNRIGKYHEGREEDNICKLAFLDILSDGKLDKTKGSRVFNMLGDNCI